MNEMHPPKLVAALIKARTEFGTVGKSKTAKGEKFSYQYADLHTAIEATQEALGSNGLAVVQTTRIGADGKGVILVTHLMHDSGESVSGEYPICPVKMDPQGYGSALTYARRYTYLAILGIAPEDDDGQAGSTPPRPVKQTSRPVGPDHVNGNGVQLVSKDQANKLLTLIKELKELGGNTDKIKQDYGIVKTGELPARRYTELVDKIQKSINARRQSKDGDPEPGNATEERDKDTHAQELLDEINAASVQQLEAIGKRLDASKREWLGARFARVEQAYRQRCVDTLKQAVRT
jgi:hypothetical protein